MKKLTPNKTVFGTKVRIVQSGETGVVEGFSVFRRNRVPQFLVEYTAADGRFTTEWFHQDQLEVSE